MFTHLLLAHSVSIVEVDLPPVFRAWGVPAYDTKYRCSLCTASTADGKTCTKATTGEEGGHWGSHISDNPLNDDEKLIWEANTDGQSAWFVTFEKAVTFRRIVYAPRNDVYKGAPKLLTVQITEDGQKWKDLETYKFSANSISIHVLYFSKDITAKGVKFVYKETINGYASLRFFALYTHDPVLETYDQVFTDGTWSKLNEGWNDKAKLEEYNKSLKDHPLSSGSSISVSLQQLSKVYQQLLDGKDLAADVVELECRGREWVIFTDIKVRQHFKVYKPTGHYWIRGELFHSYCDGTAYSDKGSAVQILRMKPVSYRSGFEHIDVSEGHTALDFDDEMGQDDAKSLNVHTALWFCQAKPSELVKTPRCRFEKNHEMLVYTIGDNEEEFEKRFNEYSKKLSKDWKEFITDKSKVPNMIEARSKNNLLYTTVTAANSSLQANKKAGKTISDVLKLFDEMQDLYQNQTGLIEGDKDPRMAKFKATYISRAEIFGDGAGSAWSDRDFTGYKGDHETMLSYPGFTSSGWGFWHEWGHAYENRDLEIVEVTVNLYSLAMQRYLGERSRLENQGNWQSIEKCVNQPVPEKGGCTSLWDRLAQLRQLEIAYPGAHARIDSYDRVNGTKTNCTGSYEKLSRWIYGFTQVYGYNGYDAFKFYDFACPELKENGIVDSYFNKFPIQPVKSYLLSDRVAYYKGQGYKENKYPRIVNVQKYGESSYTFNIELNLDSGNDFDDIVGFIIYDANNNHIGYTSSSSWVPHSSIDLNQPQIFQIALYDMKFNEKGNVVYKWSPPETLDIDQDLNNYNEWTWEPYPTNMGSHHEDNSKFENLKDDNTDTCYMSASGYQVGDERGIIVDFNSTKKFSGIQVAITRHGWNNQPYGYHKNFRLYVSNDNVTWTKITTRNCSYTNPNSKEIRYVLFSDIAEGRYLKYVMVGNDQVGSPLFTLCRLRLIGETSGFEFDLDSSPDLSGRSAGWYAGVIVGSIVAVCVVAAAIVIFVRVKVLTAKKTEHNEV